MAKIYDMAKIYEFPKRDKREFNYECSCNEDTQNYYSAFIIFEDHFVCAKCKKKHTIDMVFGSID
jgi:predicted SprT family Zn-dependent metalloprotease